MKFVGMSHALLLAVLSSLLFAASAGAATEGVAPLRASVGNGGDAVASGTDIFWTSDRKIKPMPKNGYLSTTSLWRTSFLGGAKTLVKQFDPKDTTLGFPSDLKVGGDFVYVTMEGDGPESNEARTTILRMRRDGSDVQTIARGKLDSSEENSVVIEKGKGRLNDCGTTVEAQLATDDGGVVIRETTAQRESKACGRKRNIDHHRYYLLTATGVVREILTDSVRVSRKFKVGKDGSYEGSSSSGSEDLVIFNVIGDRALIARFRKSTLSYYVRDLNTGGEFGPYITRAKGLDPFSLGSMDAAGRVALTGIALSGTKKNPKFNFVSGVFPVADPNTFLQIKGQSLLMFCGNHLIAETAKGARELDPLTLNLLRPIAPLRLSYDIDTCDSNYLYMSRTKGRGAKYLAYPLN